MTDYEFIIDRARKEPVFYYIINGELYVKVDDELVKEKTYVKKDEGLIEQDIPLTLYYSGQIQIKEICEENMPENFEEISKLISKVKQL